MPYVPVYPLYACPKCNVPFQPRQESIIAEVYTDETSTFYLAGNVIKQPVDWRTLYELKLCKDCSDFSIGSDSCACTGSVSGSGADSEDVSVTTGGSDSLILFDPALFDSMLG